MALVTYDTTTSRPVTYAPPAAPIPQPPIINNTNPFADWWQQMMRNYPQQKAVVTYDFPNAQNNYYNQQLDRGFIPPPPPASQNTMNLGQRDLQAPYMRTVARSAGLQATGLPGGTKPFSLAPVSYPSNYDVYNPAGPYRPQSAPFGGLRNPALRRMEEGNPQGFTVYPKTTGKTTSNGSNATNTWPGWGGYSYGGGGGGGYSYAKPAANWYMGMLTWRI